MHKKNRSTFSSFYPFYSFFVAKFHPFKLQNRSTFLYFYKRKKAFSVVVKPRNAFVRCESSFSKRQLSSNLKWYGFTPISVPLLQKRSITRGDERRLSLHQFQSLCDVCRLSALRSR